MAKYFLGVDAGATKSHVMIASEDGQVLGLGKAGTGNPDYIGQDGFKFVMEEALSQALQEAKVDRKEISGAGFGVAGFDWESQRMEMMESIHSLQLDCPVELVNDALIALMAGVSCDWGVAVIAGTSCNAWGISKDGHFGRMAGFSRLGENAGSYEIVAKALQEISKAWSKRGPKTKLTQAFMEFVHAKDENDLIEGVSLRKYDIGPAQAPIVFDVAKAGDPVAQELVRWAGSELGDLALGVIRQLELCDQKFEIVLSGSFYKGSPEIKAEMKRVVHAKAPNAEFVFLTAPSVIGGVLLGMKASGQSTEKISSARNKLMNHFRV